MNHEGATTHPSEEIRVKRLPAIHRGLRRWQALVREPIFFVLSVWGILFAVLGLVFTLTG